VLRDQNRQLLLATDDPFSAEQEAWAQPFGLADIAYVPWLLRARDMLGVDMSPYPALSDWVERLSERPSVAAEAALVAALQPA